MPLFMQRFRKGLMVSKPLPRVVKVLIMGLAVMSLGITGYSLVEDMTVGEAFYMTVITITTVGFKEVKALSENGRYFTVFLIFCGVGIWAYSVSTFGRVLVEGHLRDLFGMRRAKRRIRSMKNHIIVCGYGRMGKLVSREIARERIPFVVIECKADMAAELLDLEYAHIIGDATEEEILKEVGVESARSLIAVLPSDAGNVYVALTGRALNPDLHIICRAESPGSEGKMMRAGANKVISPYEIGGLSLAQAALRPNVLSFFEMAATRRQQALGIEEMEVHGESPLIGKTLLDARVREKFGVSVVAYRKPGYSEIIFNPPPTYTIEKGAVLLAMGDSDGLKNFAKKLLKE